jgi:hypothetical protein
LILAVFALSLLLLALLAVAAVQLPGLRADLTTVRTGLSTAEQALRGGDATTARGAVDRAARSATSARHTTDGRLWSLAGRLPGVGRPFRELAAVSEAAELTTSGVAQPLVRLEITPKAWTGRLDSAPLRRAQAPLRQARTSLDQARRVLAAAPTSSIGAIDRPRAQLDRALRNLAATVRETSVAADVLPDLVGTNGTRRYFLGIQNTAEPRATGGLIGSYGIVRADRGRFTQEHVGSDNELTDPPRPVVSLGPEYDDRYARFGAAGSWRSANLSPDVPTVGRILTALWKDRTGQRLDGVILVDATALAHLLNATGPVRLADGTRLTSRNAVDVLLRDAYRRFPRSQDAQRNDYLQQVAKLVFAKLQAPGLSPSKLLREGARAVGGGHLQVWSTDNAVEARLRDSAAGGALPRTSPYLRVVPQDAGGSKLGYYLRTKVEYDARRRGEAVDLGAGPEVEEEGFVRITLTNTAPRSGLPEYVTLRADAPDGKPRPVGQIKLWLSVYLGRRATVLGVTRDGHDEPLQTQTEQGHTVGSTFLSLDPGASTTLVLRVRQPLPRVGR